LEEQLVVDLTESDLECSSSTHEGRDVEQVRRKVVRICDPIGADIEIGQNGRARIKGTRGARKDIDARVLIGDGLMV
jgi:hypothetical protein